MTETVSPASVSVAIATVEIPAPTSGRKAEVNPWLETVKALAADRTKATALTLTGATADEVLKEIAKIARQLTRAGETVGVTVRKQTATDPKTPKTAILTIWAVDKIVHNDKPATAPATSDATATA